MKMQKVRVQLVAGDGNIQMRHLGGSHFSKLELLQSEFLPLQPPAALSALATARDEKSPKVQWKRRAAIWTAPPDHESHPREHQNHANPTTISTQSTINASDTPSTFSPTPSYENLTLL
jgi:hypothetical protein